MVTLGIGIGDVRLAYAQYLFQFGSISQRCPAQLGPVPPFAAGDHVVNGGQSELLMSEVTV